MCDDAICPIKSSNAGKGNSLGFSGTAGSGCCVLPCPAYPIHTVTICILVNIETAVKIQQGCLKSGLESDDDSEAEAFKNQSDIGYSHGQTYDSWGRKCRVINWTRQVPDDAFIRLRFIGLDGVESPCDDSTANNAILKFEIDGADMRHMINRYLGATLGASPYYYVKAGCAGSPATGQTASDYSYLCCTYLPPGGATGTVYRPNYTINDIQRGAEIVIGPISDLPYAAVPTIPA